MSENISDFYTNICISKENSKEIKEDCKEIKEDCKEVKKIFNLSRNIVCCNCGKYGHVYKKCFNPITSLGIICLKKKDLQTLECLTLKQDWKEYIKNKNDVDITENKNIKYLLIRRKDSLAFAEFVRVKYLINDVEYIKTLLENMTTDEHIFLKKVISPDEIWNRLWTSKKKSRTRINEYNRVKKKLTFLLNGSLDENGNTFNIKSLLETTVTTRIEPEWGFPKGRRVPRETDIQCSIREFCEETDINKTDIHLLKNIGPVEEIFTGSNNILYKHLYYVAEVKTNINVSINPENVHQKAEVGDIKWFSKNEVIQKLEKRNTERINIFTSVVNYIETSLLMPDRI
jgi:8-oxo-dGTP pyrophosphatase MutT (NUDIX family)